MERYLVRAGIDPRNIDIINFDDCLINQFIGGNSGNLMFAYGVINVLKTDNVEIDVSYKSRFSDKEIAEINEKYDAFILPLADAFRTDFQNTLNGYTETIEKLKIKVVVIGVGLRADYEPDFSNSFPFDNSVKKFVKVVLDKSCIIGTRGEITAQYLSKLGFREEIDHTPIGCPSLYTYGTGVKTKLFSGEIDKLAVNLNGYYNVGFINDFFRQTLKEYPEYVLIQQLISEYADMYLGKNSVLIKAGKYKEIDDKLIISRAELEQLYDKDRVRMFFDIPTWINYMDNVDFFLGNRFHGTVAAVLAGLPHIFIPFNARTREMAEYHHITSLKPDEIKANSTLSDYINKLDYQSFNNYQKKNIDHYIDFLENNELDHIFRQKISWNRGETPLEREIQTKIGESVKDYFHFPHCYNSLSGFKKISRRLRCNLKLLKKKIVKG